MSVTDAKEQWSDLLDEHIDCCITRRPTREMIPVLRRLIDAYWTHEFAEDGRSLADDQLLSLLYYAWDRAREIETLKTKLGATQDALARCLVRSRKLEERAS